MKPNILNSIAIIILALGFIMFLVSHHLEHRNLEIQKEVDLNIKIIDYLEDKLENYD